jgi:NTE family protein
VRLNAPLKPALALGADRLVVVATHPAEAVDETAPARDDLQPQVDDQLVNVLEAVLVDRMVEDLSTLRKINAAVRQTSPSAPSPAGAGGRPGSGRRSSLPRVPARVRRSARSRDTLGKLADDVFRGLGPLRRLQPDVADLAVLRRLLASGEGPRPGDPLSYLFFHPTFAKAAFALGTDDAAEVVPPGVTAVPWST